MEQLVNGIIEFLKQTYNSTPFIVSLLFGFGLIVLESIIPILPLAAFIALNMILFGNVVGFFLSWVATVCGCMVSYSIFRFGFSRILYHNIENHPRTKKIVYAIRKISFSNLVLITAIPFTPAFSINIGAGLSHMQFRKYLYAMIIAKVFIVYFWGFVGTTLIESLTDITVIFKLVIILIFAFILSRIALKKFNIE
jgi:uncharacterized membrane protein YdjX (TVP38/TMEM64 family)